MPEPVTIPPRMHFNARDEHDIPWAVCGRTPPMNATHERAEVNCGRCLRKLREDDEIAERDSEWKSPEALPPDTRDPITKVIDQLARRWGNDSPPILEARAELAKLTRWTPLVPGCAMPEDGADVLVTVEDADGEPLVLQASYYNRTFLTPGCREFVGGNGAFEDHDEPESRLTAWMPAPEPYREAK